MSRTVLHVSGFGPDVRARDLAYEFERYGRLVRCDIPAMKTSQSNPYAFVEFRDPRDADDAHYYMEGKSIDGFRLRVEWSKRPPSQNWRFDAGARPPPPSNYGRGHDREPYSRDGGRDGGRDAGRDVGRGGYAGGRDDRRRSPSPVRGGSRRSPSPYARSSGGSRRSPPPARRASPPPRDARDARDEREDRVPETNGHPAEPHAEDRRELTPEPVRGEDDAER